MLLLQVHVPNDNRLFPGCLASQLLTEITANGEWAVDAILSHNGSGHDAIFEVCWGAEDITWLPYNQISDLHALTSYLELVGVDKVSDLPKGKGKPPTDDPQVFLGSLLFIEDDLISASLLLYLSPLVKVPIDLYAPHIDPGPRPYLRLSRHLLTLTP